MKYGHDFTMSPIGYKKMMKEQDIDGSDRTKNAKTTIAAEYVGKEDKQAYPPHDEKDKNDNGGKNKTLNMTKKIVQMIIYCLNWTKYSNAF